MRMMSILLLSVPATLHADDTYQKRLQPLFKDRCFSCHGALKQKGGLRLDTIAFMKEGGNTGPVLSPSKPDDSELLRRLQATDKSRMPPHDEGEAFTPQQLALVRTWIQDGAKGPAQEKAEEDPRKHWSFQVVVRPPVPAPKNADWSKNPMDAFISTEHERLGLNPVGPASREVSLRRVYLDLIGLPPTQEELHAFLKDDGQDAFEKVVDQLLARPQYGERWGRHWMDVWRYSDWYGRRSLNDVRNSAPQIWRWRDWIVDSLNEDKGYDRMVMEMLAADEIDPGNDRTAVATGFIVRNWYALNQHELLRNMVEHTGKAFLGLTFNCCHCHDHKYDPISHEDYFRMRAIFEPLGLRQDAVPGEPDPGPFERYVYPNSRKLQKLGLVRAYDEHVDAKTHMYLAGDERQKAPDKPPIAPGVPAFFGKDILKIEPVALPATVLYPSQKPWLFEQEFKFRDEAVAKAKQHRDGLKEVEPIRLAEAQIELAEAQRDAYLKRVHVSQGKATAEEASRAERKIAAVLAKEKWIKAEQNARAAKAKAETAAEGKDRDAANLALKKAEQAVIDSKKTADVAEKNLAAVSTKFTPIDPVYPKTSTGRRKALAEWIASPQNPLTARVAVNHIWMRHFERPLVESVFDFGRNGKAPSHPELLDFLAAEFMKSGWSMKHLHRLIVTSRTYRMASTPDEPRPSGSGSGPLPNGRGSLEIDPDNRYLHHFPSKRMEAEVVRDSLLYLTGELDLTRGGPPVENSDEAKTRRRSLYFSIYPEDGGNAAFLDVFDPPDPCECYKRSASIVPQQALALVNNALAVQTSRKLAGSIASKQDDAFLTAAFEKVLSRRPTEDERRLCDEFRRQQEILFREAAPSADAARRARESLIRVLLNHHEFVTIR